MATIPHVYTAQHNRYNNPNLAAFNQGITSYLQDTSKPSTSRYGAYINKPTVSNIDDALSKSYAGLYGEDPNSLGLLDKLKHVPVTSDPRISKNLSAASNAVHGATDIVETADDVSKLIGFNKGKGLSIKGKNIGKYVPYGVGIYQGLDALGGLSEMSDLNADADTLTSKILTSASGNPLIGSYLTSDDLALLGKLQRGTYDASGDLGDATSNLGNLLSGAGTGALMGLAGGVPGAIIGGIGGLINSGIDNMNAETTNNTARLEALYQNLLNAEQQYKSMRRPNFNGLGIQQRYQDMYM